MKDVTDGGAEFAVRLEDVTVEYHFPLDASVWGEKGSGVNRKLQPQTGTGRQAGRRTPNGGRIKGKEKATVGWK